MREIEQRSLPEISLDYLNKINRHLDNLKGLGVSQKPVILSGSAVFLYELANRQVQNDENIRIPTDLDAVLTYEDFLTILKRKDDLDLQLQKNIRSTNWGMQYHNWLLEGGRPFPLDIMMTLNTLYPDGHKFLSGELYTFPDFSKFPILTMEIGEYKLASPGYILFYKLTQMRNGPSDNGTVKQDLEDIRKILSLGIIDFDRLNNEFYILTYGDDDLRRKIIQEINNIEINNIGKCSIPYSSISKPEINYEGQIKGLRDFSHILDQVFGKGNWCYSNGTALAIHASSKGYKREITDIDVFVMKGDVVEAFPGSFFNIPFGRVSLVTKPINIRGITYLAPQLRGRVFLGGDYPIDVDIISKSVMRKGDGQEMIIEGSSVGGGVQKIADMPVMDLELIRAIKNFSLRPPPKTDFRDLELIDQLSS